MQLSVTASPLNGTSYAGSSYYKIPRINEMLVSLDM